MCLLILSPVTCEQQAFDDTTCIHTSGNAEVWEFYETAEGDGCLTGINHDDTLKYYSKISRRRKALTAWFANLFDRRASAMGPSGVARKEDRSFREGS